MLEILLSCVPALRLYGLKTWTRENSPAGMKTLHQCLLVGGSRGPVTATDHSKRQSAGKSTQASLTEICRAEENLGFQPACSLLWWFSVEKYFPFRSKSKSNWRSGRVEASSDQVVAASVTLWHPMSYLEIRKEKLQASCRRCPGTTTHTCLWLNYSCSEMMMHCWFAKILSGLGGLHKNNK